MNKQWIRSLFETNAGWEGLILRVPVGIILIAHGSQKLFAWYGGPGLQKTAAWMASIGLEPGVLMAALAGSAEFFGGLAIFFGLLTRPAALVAAITMLVALVTVHWANGLFMNNNGYEFALSLFAICTALVFMGGGKCSLDKMLVEKL